jgi:hypothetical protein
LAACWILACTAARADSTRDGIVNQANAKQLGAVERAAQPDAQPAASDAATEVQLEQNDNPMKDPAEACTCAEQCDGCGESQACSTCDSCSSCSIIEFFGPMGILNMHPSNAIFLTPAPERAVMLGQGRRSFSFKLDIASNMIRELDSGIVAAYDFEDLRISAEFREGTDRGEYSIILPLRYRSHGTLDGIITDWHKFFGLPRGLRDDYPNQLYQYTIVTRDGPVFNDEGDSFGLGDITLGYKHSLSKNEDGSEAFALRTALKLPTGDSGSANGSGAVDASIGALYQTQLSPHMRAYLNADYIFIGEPDWQNIEHTDAHTYGAGLEYALSHSSTLITQWRIQSNPLHIGSFEADKDSQELQIGLNTRLADDLVWTFGFGEDANPETAPDFTLHSYLTWDF